MINNKYLNLLLQEKWIDKTKLVSVGVLTALASVIGYPIFTPYHSGIQLLIVCILAILLWTKIAARIRVVSVACSILVTIGINHPIGGIMAAGILLTAVSVTEELEYRLAGRTLLTALMLWMTFLLIDSTGLLWTEVADSGRAFNSIIGKLSGKNNESAFASSELPWLLFAILAWIGRIIVIRINPMRMILGILGLLSIYVVGVLLNIPWLIIGSTGLTLLGTNWIERNLTINKQWQYKAVASAYVIAMGFIIIASSAHTTVDKDSIKVSIVDGGLKTLELPTRETWGDESDGADFSALTRLLPAYDFTVEIIPHEFSGKELSDTDLLLVINPTEMFTSEQKTEITNYVNDGGRLLVLGDHTNIGGVMPPLNDLLDFTGIKFRFDSAIPDDSPFWHWSNCLRGAFHPSFAGRDNNDFGISVGASLETSKKARAVVIGDNGYSDIGRPDYGVSRLGDMAYNRGELWGGLALIAQESIGDGLVEVWGDTSGFQSTSLTHTGRFIGAHLKDLVCLDPVLWGRSLWLVFLILTMFALSVVLSTKHIGMLCTIVVMAVTQSALHYIFINGSIDSTPASWQNLVAYDMSHKPSYPNADTEDTVRRLSQIVFQSDSLLLDTDHLDNLSHDPMAWVISAPNKQYSKQEAQQLHEYVKRGGTLVVASGLEHKWALENVLTEFDADISSTIIGAAHNARIMDEDWREYVTGKKNTESSTANTAVYDADINFSVAYGIKCADADELAHCWDSSIALTKQIGKGKFVIIGDSRFLTNRILSRGTGYAARLNRGNAKFVANCLGFFHLMEEERNN